MLSDRIEPFGQQQYDHVLTLNGGKAQLRVSTTTIGLNDLLRQCRETFGETGVFYLAMAGDMPDAYDQSTSPGFQGQLRGVTARPSRHVRYR